VSYELLTGLYFSEAANAALTSPEARSYLHVSTRVEDVIKDVIRRGLDLVLTGNPGDGKSHLVRMMVERGELGAAEVEDDLSAHPTGDVLRRWSTAAQAGRPFVLCANEGPLKDLLDEVPPRSRVAGRAHELRTQLGRLLAHRPSDLAPAPAEVILIDLADRSVLEARLIDEALQRVTNEHFLPVVGDWDAADTSSGRNLLLLAQHQECRRRLGAALLAAGRRCGEHVSFRHLWAGIAFALTRAKPVARLDSELRRDADMIGTLPLDNLVHRDGRGILLEAARSFADPALVTDPDLDEQIWATGQPSTGNWIVDFPPRPEAPSTLWRSGDRQRALERLASIKRAVAFAHDRGGHLIERLGEWRSIPSEGDDGALMADIIRGVRALYLSPDEERAAPDWLTRGVPLFVNFTYEERAIEDRPHVAVRAIAPTQFELLRPVRAPWLSDALGELPEEVWLSHRPSGIALRLQPSLLHVLAQARRSTGPLPTPEPVHRFLARLAGWDETHVKDAPGGFAVLRHPRGELACHGFIRSGPGGRSAYGMD
jgi:hypothetical protein